MSEVSVPGQGLATILVSTNDAYAACWDPFCHGFQKYWPDCPYPVVFTTNLQSAPCGTSIMLGKDPGWSRTMLQTLEKVQTPFLIYMQEDYWLRQPISSEVIASYIQLMAAGLADFINLNRRLPFSGRVCDQDSRLSILDTAVEYRASLQIAIWRRQTFLDLLEPDESPWQFEGNGTIRSRRYEDRFLVVSAEKDKISYVNAVDKGEWREEAYRYAQTEGIEVDFHGLHRALRMRRMKRTAQKQLGKIRRVLSKLIKGSR